ncbi:transcription factor PIF7-like isoform X1 [Prosopis cineraria]|uniref:transcription factor PIF7-like isoform X1 n=1 Tax=Prosopis cineraria TaxID=364024 RepID=UPI00240EBD48|nr:transcription factor PIF7-like isoform X1 [Prosopis cineraria]
MSNHEVAELTWENGQPVMHGLGGLLATAHQKSTWIRAHDTLESIVQQAACQRPKSNFLSMPQDWTPTSISSTVAPSGGTTMPPDVSGRAQSEPTLKRKQVQSDSGYLDTNGLEECEPSSGGCASVSAFRSLKRSKTLEDDSHSHCESENQEQDEDRDTKEETGRSNPTRRNRAAAAHNQSERVVDEASCITLNLTQEKEKKKL